MAMTPGAVGSGMKQQAYRRGGSRNWRNKSQLVGADDGDDAIVGANDQKEGSLPLVVV